MEDASGEGAFPAEKGQKQRHRQRTGMAHHESCSVSTLSRECGRERGRWLVGQLEPRAFQTRKVDDGPSESL